MLFIFSSKIINSKIHSKTKKASPIDIIFFYGTECEECKYIKKNILNDLEQNYPVSIKSFNIEDEFEYLISLEESYGVHNTDIPVIFIGKRVLSGTVEIEDNLINIIENVSASAKKEQDLIKGEENTPPHLDKNDTAQDFNPKANLNDIYIAFFSKQGCQKCSRAYYDFKYLQKKYPNLVIKTFHIDNKDPKDKLLNEALSLLYKIPEKKRLVAPTIFIGDDYLIGEDVSLENLKSLITKYSKKSYPPPWEKVAGMQDVAKKNILSRFRAFKISAIIFAGLLDGINPCAFVTIIFFISYLKYIGRKGKEIILVGSAFSFAVFIAYLLVGLGVLSFVRSLKFLPLISNIIYILTAIFVFILGILSLKDYFICKRGDIEDMKLQLPDKLKRMIHKTIKKRANVGRYILGALSAGFIVSFLELACTGQVYLPTIIFASKISRFRLQGILYLLLYNIMFILPLIIIFLTVYVGTSSEQLSDILQEHAASVKLATYILFFSFSIFLVLTIIF